MTYLKIRTTFSNRIRIGTRTRYLNKRTLQNNTQQSPILLIDLDYLLSFLEKKKITSEIDVSERVSFILDLIMKKICPSGIIFTSKSRNTKLPLPNISPIYGDVCDIVFTIKTNNLLQQPITILSDDITLWSIASTTSNLTFILLDSSYRSLHYNNKTGLEILSKLIGTYKIINKLRLNRIKYMSLQYLFILLHYIKVTHGNDPAFYFDGTYFKQYETKHPFLKSNGLGLSLLADAHKFLSYSFLTKPEFLDYFLLGNSDHYFLQLSRLTKLLPLDVKILLVLKQHYDSLAKPRLISDLTLPDTHPILSSSLRIYSNIWSKINTSTSYTQHKAFAKLLRKYWNMHPTYALDALVATLPQGLKKDFDKKVSKNSTLSDDTPSIDSAVLDYVANLITGGFSGKS